MPNEKRGARIFIAVLLILFALIGFLIVRSFLTSLIAGAVLSYLFHPLYAWMHKKTKSKNFSAALVTILIILIIVIPTSVLLFQLAKEASYSYLRFKQLVYTGFKECKKGFICDALKKPEIKNTILEALGKITEYLAKAGYEFVFTIPKRVLELILIFFTSFFLLRDGKEIIHSIRKYTPLAKKQEEKIFEQLKEVTRAIIKGFFFVAIIESIIAAIMFKLAGISAPILWATIIGVLAFIPLIGPTIIWIPAALIQLFLGNPLSLFIILAGGILISFIDTFFKPKLVGQKAKIHPLLVVIGLFGGLRLLGIIGIIAGPLILALIITFVKMYKETTR